ncbi:hypothetical protein [Rouxiella sp. Mn2063]|uniref:hypothetical protein n=1 Tax=Rouxiella sp. Mn2063 TaxID=3395262 RepID=UPI003BD31399
MKNIDFARNDKDIYSVLVQATNEEKAFLAEIISNKYSSGITKDERDPLKLVSELHSMGGDSVMNLLRRRGVNYREIVEDVASKVGIKVDSKNELMKIEEKIAEKVITDYKKKLSAHEREKFEEVLRESLNNKLSMDAKNAAARSIGSMTPALMAVGGFILRRGAIAAIPVAGQFIGVLTGVIGVIFAFTGTAYSVTIPAVLIIGSIRARLAAEKFADEVDL